MRSLYSDDSVKGGPHTRRWSEKIPTELKRSYRTVTSYSHRATHSPRVCGLPGCQPHKRAGGTITYSTYCLTMVTHDRVLHYVVTTLCIITAQRPLLLIPTLLQTARRVARQSLTRRVFTVSLDGILSLVLVESRVVLCSNVQCRRVARERQAVPCSPGVP